MILVFALAGSFTAIIAGVTALIMGQSWWVGLVSYITVGMLTVSVLATFAAFAIKGGTDRQAVGAGLPIGER